MKEQETPKIILIVDDDPDILEIVNYNLTNEGYLVYTAENGKKAIPLIEKVKPDLILLDVMMPEMDGIELCQIIRKDLMIEQPLIAFLTARSEDYSQVAGFEVGADDYITKPIRPRLLLSKIAALLRRSTLINSNIISPSGIQIDYEKFMVTVKGTKLFLPKKEFELLTLLAKRPGKVFTRDQIMSLVWGTDAIVGERTIDVHIRKLREKLGDDYIRTIKGVGYTIEEN
jgi:two-component system alkaline phosphatase synthesis response regulator PhoP